MKKLNVILSLIILSSKLYSNDVFNNNEVNKEQLAEKRTHKEQLLQKKKEELKNNIHRMDWTITANSLKSGKGRSNKLDPVNNYLQIHGQSASIQLNSKDGKNYSNSDVISIVGEINDFEVKECNNPSAPLYISMHITNEFLSSASVIIYVYSKGNAIVNISPSTGENTSVKGFFAPN